MSEKPSHDELLKQTIKLKKEVDLLNRRYRSVVDYCADAILLTSPDGNIHSANRAACELFHMTEQEIIAGGRSALVDENDPKFADAFEIREKKGKFIGELLYRKKDGSKFPGHTSSVVFQDEEGNQWTSTVIRDLSDFKEKEQILQCFIEYSPAAIAMFDRNMRYIRYSRRWLTEYHLGDRALRGLSHYEVFPEIPERWKEVHRRALAGEVLQNPDDRFERADGSVHWESWEVQPWYDAAGNIGGIIIFREDITERKKYETALLNSERRWRDVLMYTPQIGITIDTRSKLVFANRYFLQLTGWQEEEIIGKDWFDFFIPESIREEIRNRYSDTVDRGDASEFLTSEYEIVSRSGELHTVKWFNVFSGDGNGNISDITCLGVDLTEQKRLEDSLIRSSREWQNTFDAINSAIWILDLDQRVVRSNKAAELYFQQPVDKMIGRHCWEICHGTNQPIPECPIKHATDNNRCGKIEWQAGKKWFEVSVSPFLDSAGVFSGYVHIVNDITERKRSEIEVRKSESHFRAIFELSTIGKSLMAPDGKLVQVNKAFADMLGYKTEELLQLDLARITYPDDMIKSLECIRTLMAREQEKFRMEKRYIHKSGAVVWGDVSAMLLYDDRGMPLYLITSVLDITERKLADEKIIQLGRIFENVMNEIYLFDPDTLKFILVNETGRRNLGYTMEELDRLTPLDIKPEFAPESFADLINPLLKDEKKKIIFETHHKRKDQSTYPVEIHLQLIEYDRKTVCCAIVMDITERKLAESEKNKLEGQYRQAQKMESVGRLAGGIAHDFNNMLGIIIGNAEMALTRPEAAGPVHANLEEICTAANRSADLVRQLLAFARKQTITPKILDLNETVEGMLKMLRRLVGEDIDLAWMPGANIWTVRMDPSQIDQILANLCVNSRDAIQDVGMITIETSRAMFDEAYCKDHAGFVPGDYVLLAVSDDGSGMSPEIIKNLFEPFFTTKETGKGTGLGLATVYGIVKQNNGFINVYSEPDKGTTFRIYLPRYEDKAEPIPEKDREGEISGGNETILVVEDEPAILKMTTIMLEQLGYHVLGAHTPEEAVRVACAHADEIHLLVTDVVMPGMNGRDLARNLLLYYPNLKSLFMSGYTANVIAHHGILEEGVSFLQKPFSMQNLAAMVRKALSVPGEQSQEEHR